MRGYVKYLTALIRFKQALSVNYLYKTAIYHQVICNLADKDVSFHIKSFKIFGIDNLFYKC